MTETTIIAGGDQGFVVIAAMGEEQEPNVIGFGDVDKGVYHFHLSGCPADSHRFRQNSSKHSRELFSDLKGLG
jgi:hypothetical protein